MRLKFFAAVFLCLFLFAPLSHAVVVKDAHTEVELVADVSAVQPGSKFRAGILFRMDPEWHVYWKNPGDSGMPPKIQWQLPEGVSAGDIEWPAPHKIDLPPLSSYGYEKEVLLAAPFQSESASEAALILKADLNWLACKVECIPGKAHLELALPVEQSARINEATAKLFSETRSQIPITETEWNVSVARLEKNIQLQLRPKNDFVYDLSSVHFFAEHPQLTQHAAGQVLSKTTDGYQLQVPLAVNAPKTVEPLKGVLVSPQGWRGVGSETGWEINIPFSPINVAPRTGFWTAVLFAFLGGLILNLMPCVLPVLSIKILSFVREASEQPKAILKHGIVFSAGVIVSFWVLAAALVLFQTAGKQVGWGFQLQSPLFVFLLFIVFFLFALNLFGLFEIGTSLGGVGSRAAGRRGLAGAFASGVLATVVATPCTAPFMGAALGFALTQPVIVVWTVFTALGLGMAAPYLLLCANPKWLRFVPKPGPWMMRLKKILGLFLLLTAFWLLWILGLQTGMIQKIYSKARSENKIAWEPYSEARLAELRALGKPVFIDFTAAWCLTCQVNERVALEVPKVTEQFKQTGLTALKADWTNQDAAITRALTGYGRNSIPLYVLYGTGGETEPVLLPELLTPSIVLQALQDAGLQNEKDGLE